MAMSPDDILMQTAHRPWPLPSMPWFMFQQWSDLLFAHWALDPTVVLRLVPKELELDLFDGKAWVSLTPFRMTDIHLRGLPPLPGAGQFLEMNLRTYVRRGSPGIAHPHAAPGDDARDQQTRPGIYFFALEASNLPAVMGARVGFGLPYHWAEMSASWGGKRIHYLSKRRGSEAQVNVEYAPIGKARQAKTDLERFLTERYCLYEVRMGTVLRTQIQHGPWMIHDAEAMFMMNTMGQFHELPLANVPDLLHFSKQLDVLVYPPEVAARE